MTDSSSGEGRPRGVEVLIDLGGVRAELLEDVEFLERAAQDLCRLVRARVLELSSFRHEPPGYTIHAVLPQGHLTLHAQSDTGAAFINIFVRGIRLDDEGLVDLVEKTFEPERTGWYSVPRTSPGTGGRRSREGSSERSAGTTARAGRGRGGRRGRRGERGRGRQEEQGATPGFADHVEVAETEAPDQSGWDEAPAAPSELSASNLPADFDES